MAGHTPEHSPFCGKIDKIIGLYRHAYNIECCAVDDDYYR